MVEFNPILREFSGNKGSGWMIADDNCALFNPTLYREYVSQSWRRFFMLAPGERWVDRLKQSGTSIPTAPWAIC
jgi:hypothetical protein